MAPGESWVLQETWGGLAVSVGLSSPGAGECGALSWGGEGSGDQKGAGAGSGVLLVEECADLSSQAPLLLLSEEES